MRNLTCAASLALAAAALAACADQPTTPSAARDAGPLLSAATACAASPTVVVGTEAELRAAVAAAQPGDVIAISGMIPLATPGPVPVTTPGVTLTCAEPGAGLSLVFRFFGILLDVQARDVTISGLELDAEYGYAAVVGFNTFGEDYSGIRVVGNTVGCGYISCVFFVGTRGTQITDNHFEGDSTNTGIQFQAPSRTAGGIPINPVDGAVIARNVLETERSYPSSIYGAIRVRDGSNVTIEHNEIGYGWSAGIVLTNVFDSRVEHNRVEGPLRYGIGVEEIVALPVTLRGVSFTGNQVTHAGTSAFHIARACNNGFTGNNVQQNDLGAVFRPSTGANVWRGNPGVVQDAGAYDCDGDGDVDPNQISGARASASVAAAPSFSAAATPVAGASNGRYPALQ